MTREKTRLRCAIYTRKSTEEGLDQQFNSLDAQREACEAYILSQAGEGWECLPEMYDDGGWSGGNMDRPALKALIEQITKGRVDIVVVYKVDRLTRSLMDFARLVETFDRHEVSFVSVTQAFNTTNSMGRLTLNVLLSFAQFEREVTAERIRDKIAASKARGMWMGGNIPLGYDLGERVLLINAGEAEQVRHIFTRYLALGSLTELALELDREGIRSKCWTSRRGNAWGGQRFSCGGLAHILKNRIYRGDVVHKGKAYRGDHEAIIDAPLFARVQEQLAVNRHRHVHRRTRAAACPLLGRIFDAQELPMRPSFSYGRGKRVYRYYVSESLLPAGRIANAGNQGGTRVSAQQVERRIAGQLAGLLPADECETEIFPAIARVTLSGNRLHLVLAVSALADGSPCQEVLLERARQIDPGAKLMAEQLHLSIDAPPIRRGRTVRARVLRHVDPERDGELADLIRTAHRKLAELHASPLDHSSHAQMRAPTDAWSRERIGLGLLAPDIQKVLLQGKLPSGLDQERLLSREMPLDWDEQRRFLGFVS